MPAVQLLDYVAGNVRSLVNAIEKVGYEVEWIKTPEQVASAEVSFLVSSRTISSPTSKLTNQTIETHPARRRPLRPLPHPTLLRRLPARH